MKLWLCIGTWVTLTGGSWIYSRFKDKDYQRVFDAAYYQFIAIAVVYLLHRYWLPLLK